MLEEKYSFQKPYTLLPQSPLIHFQWNQSGAALRATEVKPKLDRYIIRRYGKPLPDGWENKQSPGALKYKLRIALDEQTNPIKLGKGTDYDIYFANMNEKKEGNKENAKKGIYSKTKLTVSCFIPELLKFIDKIIGDFFVVTNFGSMQDKGFGCYLVKEKTNFKRQHIASLLKDEYGCSTVYNFSVYIKDKEKPIEETQKDIQKILFKNIKVLHNTLKAGNAFSPKTESVLFKYMNDKYGIKSEKEWLHHRANHSEAYYVRALMGVSDHMGPVDKPSEITSKTIERVPSPILFVIVQNTVYFVGRRIPEELYDAEFEFESESKKLNSGKLAVPGKDIIGENFIDDYLAYAFDEINKMKNFRFRIWEVK